MGVSAAIIVKDGERSIERALKSLLPAVDEIIVVDTGSTDGTAGILDRLAGSHESIKLYSFEWVNDFAAARNYALSQVSHDWTLVLDADEYLPESEQHKPRLFTKRLDGERRKALLYVVIDNTTNGVVTSSFDQSAIRLFPSSVRYAGAIHEGVVNAGDMEVHKCDLHILHDGYDQTLVDQMAKRKRNMTMIHAALKLNPDDAKLWMQLGREIRPFDPDAARRYFDIAEARTNEPQLLHWINESRKLL